MLIDTHCHIHGADYPLGIDDVMARAKEAGVVKLVCVGTTPEDSRLALDVAMRYDDVYAAVGVHPHDSKDGIDGITALVAAGTSKLVAVGEVGLDYYYSHSPRDVQIAVLEQQLQIAQDADLPVIFHVRDAFDDFWPVLDNFSKVRGVLHSFTDTMQTMEKGVSRGFFIGVNGISTFTKDTRQQEMFRHIPLEKLLLETDAPFLTPAPYRGKVNEPGRVREVAQFHATIRNISLDDIATRTSQNATALFGI